MLEHNRTKWQITCVSFELDRASSTELLSVLLYGSSQTLHFDFGVFWAVCLYFLGKKSDRQERIIMYTCTTLTLKNTLIFSLCVRVCVQKYFIVPKIVKVITQIVKTKGARLRKELVTGYSFWSISKTMPLLLEALSTSPSCVTTKRKVSWNSNELLIILSDIQSSLLSLL